MPSGRDRAKILTAIKHEQFYVVYQPVVDTRTLSVTGEAKSLLRWRHPAGEIPPDAFITMPKRGSLSYR